MKDDFLKIYLSNIIFEDDKKIKDDKPASSKVRFDIQSGPRGEFAKKVSEAASSVNTLDDLMTKLKEIAGDFTSDDAEDNESKGIDDLAFNEAEREIEDIEQLKKLRSLAKNNKDGEEKPITDHKLLARRKELLDARIKELEEKNKKAEEEKKNTKEGEADHNTKEGEPNNNPKKDKDGEPVATPAEEAK